MCGYVGYVGPNASDKREDISLMRSLINHRGPNANTINTHQDVIIGFNRLAINDLSANGNQPFTVDNTTVYCNGEIYNHKELREKYDLTELCRSTSDVEIVPHLYNRFGLDCLSLFNGMFALCIIDHDKDTTYLALDRFAQKPMYLSKRKNGYYFASELKCFMLGLEDAEIDRDALNIGFFLGMFAHNMTPIKGVERLAPAELVAIKDGEITRKVWYQCRPNYHIDKLDNIELEREYYKLFDDAVRLRMEADVEAGVFLSGGLDSSSITESAQRQYPKKVHSFTGIVDGKSWSTDNVNSIKFAKEYNIYRHEVPINTTTYDDLIVKTCYNNDEIPFESCQLNFMAIAEEAQKYVTILLDGTGGDELFLGYPWHKLVYSKPRWARDVFPFLGVNFFKRLSKTNYRTLIRGLMLSDVRKFIFFFRAYVNIDMMNLSPHFKSEILFELLDDFIPKYKGHFNNTSSVNHLSYLENSTTRMLQYFMGDRSSMAYSIENRSPFSDYRIWEFAMGIDEKRKLKTGTKTLMREISSKLPDYIRNAEKDGFSTPIFQWFIKDADFLNSKLKLVSQYREMLDHYLGHELVKAILDKWISKSNLVWMDGINLHMLVSFVVWYKIFFEEKRPITDRVSFSDFV